MGRLDPVYSNLLEKLKTEMPVEKREEIEDELGHREDMLNSIYHQVTVPHSLLPMPPPAPANLFNLYVLCRWQFISQICTTLRGG